MKIYMDVCCLNRPFDDQSQEKVRLETEAIISILKRCDSNEDWMLIGSDIINLEILKNRDPLKRQKVKLLHDGVAEIVKYCDDIKQRASDFRIHNVKQFDSLHLASAEYANVDVLLTTDAQFIRAAAHTNAKIKVENPLIYLMEVLNEK